jgi:amino acid transporter
VIVAVWSVVVVADGGPQGRSLDVTSGLQTGSIAFALLWGVSCLAGFESIQVFRDETRNPARTIPRATYLTVLILTGFYCVGSYVYLVAYGTEAAMATAADPINSFMASIGAYVGTFMKVLAYALTWTSGVAALLAIHNVAARYSFAFGRDRVLPAALARVHPRYKSPVVAASAVAVVMLVFAVGPALIGMDPVAAYTAEYGLANWGLVLLFAGTSLAVLVFFFRNRHLRVSVWKRVVAPAVALLGMLFILYLATTQRDTLFGTAERGAVGIGFILLVAVAAVLYARLLRAKRPAVFDRIGNQDENAVPVPNAVTENTRDDR